MNVVDNSQTSITFTWQNSGFDPDLIENVLLCWSESQDESRMCENNVPLSLSEFLMGSYEIDGLDSSTNYFITLIVRYFSTQVTSNSVMGATSSIDTGLFFG